MLTEEDKVKTKFGFSFCLFCIIRYVVLQTSILKLI